MESGHETKTIIHGVKRSMLDRHDVMSVRHYK